MTTLDRDRPARLLSAAARVLPAGRRDWARAMQAELAAIDEPAERWSFAWGCLRASRPLRGLLHLLAVLGTLGALLAWTASVDYPPLAWILSVMASVLAAVCWQARRSGMFGPTGDGVVARLLRGAGYLTAVALAAVALAHAHPATLEAADAGAGLLALGAVTGSFLIGLTAASARRSAATRRVLVTGAGSALGATVLWLVVVLVAPPIPASVGWALAVTAVAAATAVLANAGGSGTTEGSLLAGLLATAGTMVLVFVAVLLLARFGPDRLIPDITPAALPGQHISESRIEIVDPYVLILFLSAIAATALALAAVLTRRPAAAPIPGSRRVDH
ncbi:hypothetical protein ODJ79_35535 [Actinoplanes sp. KI2]|uniref:hypothetical protein n=1 Tax=Actinoplanes sp. KI2 TaxID=2983315 RepID=UPI0021D56C93|nr:hypothetical protein [Actinoplanes sp. KI2]MCU7729056.1 hypothetical protein [Actinoplanes sp. KI2]